MESRRLTSRSRRDSHATRCDATRLVTHRYPARSTGGVKTVLLSDLLLHSVLPAFQDAFVESVEVGRARSETNSYIIHLEVSSLTVVAVEHVLWLSAVEALAASVQIET